MTLWVLANFRLGWPLGWTDFDQLWWAARALARGQDPYAAVTAVLDYPLYYPGTAITVSLPFAALDLWRARMAFAVIAGGVFGYAIGRYRPYAWPVFLSMPFLYIGQNLQFSAFLAAAVLMPAFGFLAAAKPTIGFVTLAAQSTRRGALLVIGGSLALVLLSLVLDPTWPARWIAAVGTQSEHFAPLLFRPLGFLMLAGLLRWRDPDARLLVALSIVPITGVGYDLLPVFLVTRTRAEAAFLAVVSQVTAIAGQSIGVSGGFSRLMWVAGALGLYTAMFPALVMVLLRPRVWGSETKLFARLRGELRSAARAVE